MRQAGILAAAGIVALNEMVDRLAEDHTNAHKLAKGLAEIGGLSIEPARVQTNILFFGITRAGISPRELTERLAAEGIKVSPKEPHLLRAVTNYHVTSDDIEYALSVFAKVLNP